MENKVNYKLVLTETNPILISDEKVTEDMYVLYNNKIYNTVYSNTVPQGEILLSGFGYVMKSDCRKIVAGRGNLPTIDYSYLTTEELKSIETIDISNLAKDEHRFNHKSIDEISFRLGFEEAFKIAHDLYRTRIFDVDIEKEINNVLKVKFK